MKIIIYNGSFKLNTFIQSLVIALSSLDNEVYVMGHNESWWRKYKKGIYYLSIGDNKSNFNLFVRTLILLVKVLFYKPILLLNNLKVVFKVNDFKKKKLYYLNILNIFSLTQPDIIHIQWASHVSQFRFLLDLPDRPPIIVSMRGTLINITPIVNEEIKGLYQKTFPKIDGFHAVSKSIALEGTKFGVLPNKIKVVYSGVNIEDTIGIKSNRKQEASFHILSVGRFHWIKGFHYALDAIKILIDKGYLIHYTIVAKGDPGEILYQINDLGIQKYVTILSEMSQKQVFQKMLDSDIFLLPSVAEGIANVALEAMSVGTIVVSSDCGGMEEVIINNKNGFIFRNRNVEDIASKIEECFKLDSIDRERIITSAKLTIFHQHDLSKMGKKMLDIYKSAFKLTNNNEIGTSHKSKSWGFSKF